MTTLGFLFSQKNVVLNAPADASARGLAGIGNELKQGFLRTWSATVNKGIVIDATVSEEHTTSCEVTKNPVEDGAKITDHVQMEGAKLSIQGVISDSPLGYAVIGNIQNLARSITNIFGGSSRSIDAYNDLLKLQQSRRPFIVITGLKRYENMIITELSVPRTAQTGKAIHFNAKLEQIRIVKSKVTQGANTHPSVSSLASPTKDLGNKVTDPVAVSGGLSGSGINSTTLNNFITGGQ